MHRNPVPSRRLVPSALAVFALGGAMASCNLVLGLDDFKNCPQDPGCTTPDGPTCSDGEKNGQETDIDCGGSSCSRCADGKACNADSDCAGGTCAAGTCHTPTCSDGAKNGQETDTDCGGPACDKCADDKGCSNGSDCQSKVCTGGTCLAPTCSDLVQNGDETDTDCGGTTCGKCGVDKGCTTDADCKGGSCGSDMKCAATCTDGVKDGDETDIDCGGAGCPKCEVTQGCATGPDCETGVCQGGACVSYYEWAKQFGDSNNQNGSAVAADVFGNIYLASTVRGTVNFGGNDLALPTSAGYLALAKFDPAGSHVWSKAFPSASAYPSSIAVDTQGGFVITGSAASGISFGGSGLTGASGDNFFVARFDTGGVHVSSRLFPNGNGVAAAIGSSRYAVTGTISNAADFGCGMTAAIGFQDAAVAVYSKTNNACVWSKRFGSAAGAAISMNSNGDIVVAGRFDGTLDLGCGPLVAPFANPGTFLALLGSTTGTCIWSKQFTDPNNDSSPWQSINGVGVDGTGNITIAGDFSYAIDFGTMKLTNAGFSDFFAAQFDSTGSLRWARQFASPTGSGALPVLGVSSGGNFAVGGRATAGTDFGGGPLPKDAPFLAEFDATGQHLWSLGFPSVTLPLTVPPFVNGVAYTGAQNVVLTGGLSGQVDFGNGPMNSIGGSDVFLAKLLLP